MSLETIITAYISLFRESPNQIHSAHEGKLKDIKDKLEQLILDKLNTNPTTTR